MLGCPTGTSLELVKCLRTKDAHEVAQSHSLFQTFYSDPIAAFGPSIEVGNPSQNTRFLSNTPMEIISNGEVNEVPWMIGYWIRLCNIYDSTLLPTTNLKRVHSSALQL